MKLTGSCHCGKVQFSVNSPHPYPFNFCYCSICRKTAGGGGYAINLGAEFATLEVSGRECISVYKARIKDERRERCRKVPASGHSAGVCASALWAWDPRWPDLVHPFASVIDTELPEPLSAPTSCWTAGPVGYRQISGAATRPSRITPKSPWRSGMNAWDWSHKPVPDTRYNSAVVLLVDREIQFIPVNHVAVLDDQVDVLGVIDILQRVGVQ